jgi:hypothetical protein
MTSPDYSRMRRMERRAIQGDAMNLCFLHGAWSREQGAVQKHSLICSLVFRLPLDRHDVIIFLLTVNDVA